MSTGTVRAGRSLALVATRLTAAAALLAAVAWAMTGALGASRDAGPASLVAGTDRWHGSPLTMPVSRPAFTLTDASGRPYDLAARTAGQVTLLYFGYSHCPDQCPLVLANLAAALRAQPPAVADRVRTVVVSIDAGRDTPAVMGDWMGHFDAGFVGLTGSASELAAAQRSVGLPVATPATVQDLGTGKPAHGTGVIAFTGDDVAHWVYGPSTTYGQWMADLPRLVARQAHPQSRGTT